ncbi:uncharacterized protein LOC143215742 isoform X2 [Lasioglossum baleicum]|uniref:uncharacterized protein LOC143215742 isoform X2 n=1 Tax=Lasioglossum baleicum TaxID=434251 RepID=UPI003FCC4434
MSVMSDLTKNLLTQYYGLNSEATGRKFLSIRRSIENVKSEEVKQVTEQTSVTTNEENISEDECQKNTDDERKPSIESEKYRRSSRAFNDIEDAYDSDENSIIYEIDSRENVAYNIHENTESGAESNEVSKAILIVVTKEDGPKDTNESDSSLTFAEDTFPDNTSNVSSITLKKSVESSRINSPLPLVTKKEPVCNETFADFSNTGLKRFPKEILNETSQLRMLYLADNDLIELPDEMFTLLKQLKWLDVRNNQISSLPNSIESHRCIETLLLQANSIKELPLELCTLPKLKTLQVAQNPLVTPPEDIVALGITSILTFLRTEWNKVHPEHRIEFKECKIEPKLSTILCYQSPRNSKKKIIPPKVQGYNRNSSTKEKCKIYKPSNRCEGKGANASEERRIVWYSKARDLLAKQALILQKSKDENVLKKWRRDRRSFNIAIEKAMRRSGDDIPFGFDLEDYNSIFKQAPKSKTATSKGKDKQKFNPPKDINMTINKLLESLNHLDIKSMDVISPRTKQSLLKKDIEKILQFQNEIKKLQNYNDVATASLKI